MYRKGFFKGWYYKQEKGGQAVAFIPAVHLSGDGKGTASIQVITEDNAWNFDFPLDTVRLSDKKDTIQIENNYFSPKGFRVNLIGKKDGKPVKIEGRIAFGNIAPLKGDIMGPFRFIPFLQCRHGVVSMSHKTKGSIQINGDSINFHGGRGYAEKDCGCSFPSYYFWSQCGWYDRQECSVMVSVADIPLAGCHFPGCIAFVYFGGKEYRLATYLGVKILRFGDREVLLKQGNMLLYLRVQGHGGQKLKAPEKGSMDRLVKENLVCKVWCRFWKNGKLLFDHVGAGSAEFITGNSMET